MKIICEKNDLLSGISTVQRALSTKTTIPVLEGIVIETVNNSLKLTATDLSLGIESIIQAEIITEGKVLLPGRLLSEIARKLPEGSVEISISDKKATITAENTKTTMAVMNIDEYPNIPKVEGESVFTIPQKKIRTLINRTSFAVATDESRPILTGCLFEINDSEIRIVALDGYRLALADESFKTHLTKSIVVPGHAMSEIAKILTDDDTPINICIQSKHVMFDLGHTKIISRLLEGDFIKYKSIIPQDFTSEIVVNKKMLEDSVERASLIARENKTNFIVMSLRENILVITSKSEMGNAHEEIPVSLFGKELEIGFNSKYFTDCLKVIDEEFVKLCFNSSLSPCVVKPTEGFDYMYLILPVRM